MSASAQIRERILTHQVFFPGDLAREFGVTQPAVHHVIADLTRFQAADLEKVPVGRRMRYRLRTPDETRKRRTLAKERGQQQEIKAIHVLLQRATNAPMAEAVSLLVEAERRLRVIADPPAPALDLSQISFTGESATSG